VVIHACYLANRSPSTSVNLQIPEEIWLGESADYSTLQIFGCPVYNLVDSQKRNVLESKSKKCTFIGFTKGVEGFILWNPERRSAFTNIDVVFDEKSTLQEKSEAEDKAQGGAPDSLTHYRKRVEFSDDPKKPDRSDEDSSDSDRDEQEATHEQP